MKNSLKLDEEEVKILQDFERGELTSVNNFKEAKRQLEEAAREFLQKGNNGQKELVFYRGQRCTYQRKYALRWGRTSPRCCRYLCFSRAKYPSKALVDFGIAGSSR